MMGFGNYEINGVWQMRIMSREIFFATFFSPHLTGEGHIQKKDHVFRGAKLRMCIICN